MKYEQTYDSENFVSYSGIIYILLCILGLWGCLSIYNATVFSSSPFFYAGKQFLWLITGMMVLMIVSKVPFALYANLALPMAIISYIPLWLVLVIGVRVNGMRGWFSIGSLFLQPSELAKVPFILLLCWINMKVKSDFKRFFVMLAVTLAWISPIALQPDFGTILIYLSGFTLVYLAGGGNLIYFLSTVLILPLLVFFGSTKSYVIRRVLGFFDPEKDPFGSGWHVMQFQYTLARGGLWGTDWGKSLWSNNYLPLAHSDSSFASLTEAVGLAGAMPVIIGYIALAFIIYRLANKKRDHFCKLFIFCMGFLIILQAFVHMSVNVTLIPPTGITLPLVSYGGSSMITTLFAFGLIISAIYEDNPSELISQTAGNYKIGSLHDHKLNTILR